MKKLILLLPILLLYSCVTEKKRSQICQSCPVITVSKDSIIYIKKDTTIYITHREVEYRDTIFCDPTGKVNEFRKVVSGGGVKATVKIKDNKLTVKCETDSLYQIIRGLITEKETWSKSNTTKILQPECKLKHQNKFTGFCFYWFLITAVYFGGKIVWKYFRSYLPLKK